MIDMSVIMLLATVAIVCLVVGLMPFLMAAPVALPYLKATYGNKYVAFILDKTNRFRLSGADIKNGVITIPKFKGMSWIKLGNSGSYSLGTCRCDVLLDCASTADEADYASAIAELERLGIPDLRTLTLQYNMMYAEKAGIELNRYNLKRISDIIEEYPDLDMEIMYPLVGKLDIRSLANWCESTPQVVASNIAEGVALESDDAKNGEKSMSMKEMMPYIMLAFAGVMIAMIVVRGMGSM